MAVRAIAPRPLAPATFTFVPRMTWESFFSLSRMNASSEHLGVQKLVQAAWVVYSNQPHYAFFLSCYKKNHLVAKQQRERFSFNRRFRTRISVSSCQLTGTYLLYCIICVYGGCCLHCAVGPGSRFCNWAFTFSEPSCH